VATFLHCPWTSGNAEEPIHLSRCSASQTGANHLRLAADSAYRYEPYRKSFRRCPKGASRNSRNAVFGLLPSSRPPCKSLSREKTILLTRATEERAKLSHLKNPQFASCASRPWFLPSQDIHLLSRARWGLHRRLSLCSLPVPKQSEESLRSLSSFAQSATCRTWQSAHRGIL